MLILAIRKSLKGLRNISRGQDGLSAQVTLLVIELLQRSTSKIFRITTSTNIERISVNALNII
jgi:hypothetical protein